MNFKINSRPLFTIIFKPKNDNFKTRDFSPNIERVLAGVKLLPIQFDRFESQLEACVQGDPKI